MNPFGYLGTWENTMAVKDGEAQNCTPKLPNVTSETHGK